MKIKLDQLDLLLAKQCKSTTDLRTGISPQTISRIRKGQEVLPKTVGKVARALGVDPADIIEKGA